MKFVVDPKIFVKFPNTRIGTIAAYNIDNSGRSLSVIFDTEDMEKKVRFDLRGVDLENHPKIKVWRDAYTVFGAKSKDQRSSIENLISKVLAGVSLRHINKLVDIYNLISLKYLLPAGGEDLDRTMGDISLTFAGENEQPMVLLGDKEARAPHVGEVIYKDTISAICRRWNWREAERTKLTPKTKNCILVVEEIAPINQSVINEATKELADKVREECGGEVSFKILDKKDNQFNLS